MAAPKKKTVTKDDLRRLMKEQSSAKSVTKRIESPLAKYNSLGNLVCVVCNCQVKSESLWNAHILGRSHKEAADALKNGRTTQQLQHSSATPGTIKRKFPEADSDISLKQARLVVAEGDGAIKIVKPLQQHAAAVLASGYSSSSTSSEDEDNVAQPAAREDDRLAAPTDASMPPPGLPADFFESSVSADPSSQQATKTSEVLPEGFFDDPKKDAKARQVEYRDKMEDEWELFQKVMKEETLASEAMIAEEDDQAAEERELEQVDEQIKRWESVDKIGKAIDALAAKPKSEAMQRDDDDSEDADAADFGELFDWRSKKVIMP